MVDRVHIGHLVFDADGADGLIYTALDGWLSSAPFRTTSNPRPNGDGDFEVDREYVGSRVITFEGGLVGSSLQDAEQNFFNEFAALQANGVPIQFAVEKDWGTRYATVSIMDVAEVRTAGRGLVAAANVQLLARDPVKYGPTRSAVVGLAIAGGGLQYNLSVAGVLEYGANGDLGRAVVSNAGTAEVWPLITVTGALTTGFYVQELASGKILRYDRVVPAGTSVSLNSRTGEVLIDGISDGSTYLTIDQWFPIPARGSVEIQFNKIGGSSGTPQMTIASADGYR